MNRIKIFSLSESTDLGKNIASDLGLELGQLKLNRFSDGEMSPEFLESIRAYKVFIVCSTHTPSDNLMELMLTLDAANRAGAKEIHIVMGYYGYGRQDRKDKKRGAVGSRVVSDILNTSHFNSIMFVDLHANQIEGLFKKPVIHIQGRSIFIPFLKKIINNNLNDYVIVSPDAGGVARAKSFAQYLDIPLMAIDKRREEANKVSSMVLMGNVTGKKVIIVDDMVDTGGSLVKAAKLLHDSGALEVNACITHGVLSGNALERIEESEIKNLYISDTVPVKRTLPKNIKVVSSSNCLSQIIKAIHKKESVNKTEQTVIS